MFDPEKLVIGTVFYGVLERNLAFQRKKIHQVIDGQDWFRYDRPLESYELVTYKVLGILRKELEGDWRFGEEYDLLTEYYLQSANNTHVQAYTTTFDNIRDNKYFIDKQEALDYIRTLEERVKEMDKS